MHIRTLGLIGLILLFAGLLAGWFALTHHGRAAAEPDIYASPVHAGCYIAAQSDCRIHVEPFTINLAVGKRMVLFRLVSIQQGTGIQRTIYDWRPDQSNPAPPSGNTYTPSMVAQDYAATCGSAYEISLQGQDTGDSGIFNLGLTSYFTCPSTTP
jgi:hypothetical protein